MRVLTKELTKKLELFELEYALKAETKNKMPVVFFNNGSDYVAESDLKTVKTNLDLPSKDNEMSFILLPETFVFFNEHSIDALEPEMISVENDFLSQYTNRLRIISFLPDEILKQVKDKRLLALGYAEQKVKKAILKYISIKKTAARLAADKSTEDSIKASYGLTIEKQFDEFTSIVEVFDQMNITKVVEKDNNLYLELDREDVIVLTNFEKLEEEISPENTFIKHFELYEEEYWYELHLLLMTRDTNLVENFHYVTYKFQDLKYER